MNVLPEAHAGVADADLSGTTVLITGSTDGIGREAALAMGRLGATVLVHGRSGRKADRVAEQISAAGGAAESYTADFTSLDAVRDLARSVTDDADRIDVLANNAGAHFEDERRTDAGIEATIAVNHLAPFLLTHLVLPSMPADGRVVTTASGVHGDAAIDPAALGDPDDYDGFEAYARSKLANVLFTRELDRRLTGRTANCFHPGLVPGSALWRDARIHVRGFMRLLSALPEVVSGRVAETTASGAAPLVYLAAAEDAGAVSGAYFVDCEPTDPAPNARDEDLARRLWDRSERLVDLDPGERLPGSED